MLQKPSSKVLNYSSLVYFSPFYNSFFGSRCSRSYRNLSPARSRACVKYQRGPSCVWRKYERYTRTRRQSTTAPLVGKIEDRANVNILLQPSYINPVYHRYNGTRSACLHTTSVVGFLLHHKTWLHRVLVARS